MERDVTALMTVKRYRYFNSHAHVERDLRPYIGNSTTRISTHTLTWSVTPILENLLLAL